MTQEQLKSLNVGDKLLYTDRDINIVNEPVEVHPWHSYKKGCWYVFVTGHVLPIHFSRLELVNK